MCLSNYARVAARHGNNKEAMMANIAAGAVLSECVVNTKTIFSFNFERKGAEMYIDCLQYIIDNMLWDAFVHGIFLGIGTLAQFGSQACVFYCSKVFLMNGTITSNKMALAMNIIMTASSGIAQSVGKIFINILILKFYS